jgi:hypothetical protein
MVIQLEDNFLGTQRSGCQSHGGMPGLDFKESPGPKCLMTLVFFNLPFSEGLLSGLLALECLSTHVLRDQCKHYSIAFKNHSLLYSVWHSSAGSILASDFPSFMSTGLQRNTYRILDKTVAAETVWVPDSWVYPVVSWQTRTMTRESQQSTHSLWILRVHITTVPT